MGNQHEYDFEINIKKMKNFFFLLLFQRFAREFTGDQLRLFEGSQICEKDEQKVRFSSEIVYEGDFIYVDDIFALNSTFFIDG